MPILLILLVSIFGLGQRSMPAALERAVCGPPIDARVGNADARLTCSGESASADRAQVDVPERPFQQYQRAIVIDTQNNVTGGAGLFSNLEIE
jgi:hypothetical protein